MARIRKASTEHGKSKSTRNRTRPAEAQGSQLPVQGSSVICIKKYANRRLYNTDSSRYVTLDDITTMVREEIDFVVVDAKTGDDITRWVLTQVIVEEESKGNSLLPVGFLRQLIRLYGDNLQWLVPGFLEQSMETFARNQERMQLYLHEAVQGLFGITDFEQVGRNQMTLLTQTMKMFSPFEQSTLPGVQHTHLPQAHPKGEMARHDVQNRIGQMQQELSILQSMLTNADALDDSTVQSSIDDEGDRSG